MKESLKIKQLRDEALSLIEKQATDDMPQFVTWRTKVSMYLKDKFGKGSDEQKAFDSRQFYTMSFSFYAPEPSHADQVQACAEGLKEVAAELEAYLQLAIESEEDLAVDDINSSDSKKKMILISHSSKDSDYAEALVYLLEDIGIEEGQLICSSHPVYKIPFGQKIYEWLGEQFHSTDLYVIFLLSDSYYSSAASLNEMGAAWMMKNKVNAFLMPGFDYDQIDGWIDRTMISAKLDDTNEEMLKAHLNEFKDFVIENFGLPKIGIAKWERKRNDFINRIKDAQNSHQVAKELIKEEADDNEVSDKEELTFMDVVLISLAINNCELMYLPMMGGVAVSAGTVGADGLSGRELALWDEVIENLYLYGYIKLVGKKDKIYRLTNAGYTRSDELKKQIGVETREEFEEYLVKWIDSGKEK